MEGYSEVLAVIYVQIVFLLPTPYETYNILYCSSAGGPFILDCYIFILSSSLNSAFSLLPCIMLCRVHCKGKLSFSIKLSAIVPILPRRNEDIPMSDRISRDPRNRRSQSSPGPVADPDALNFVF